jgi:hypothetical protein
MTYFAMIYDVLEHAVFMIDAFSGLKFQSAATKKNC